MACYLRPPGGKPAPSSWTSPSAGPAERFGTEPNHCSCFFLAVHWGHLPKLLQQNISWTLWRKKKERDTLSKGWNICFEIFLCLSKFAARAAAAKEPRPGSTKATTRGIYFFGLSLCAARPAAKSPPKDPRPQLPKKETKEVQKDEKEETPEEVPEVKVTQECLGCI